MTLGKIIEEINRLNSKGAKLTDTGIKDRYDRAIALHEDAIKKAKEAGTEINPDYLAVSMANKAYAMRHRGDDRVIVYNLLEQILENTKNAFKLRHKSYFGQARILEEMGLVVRYRPSAENPIADLENAIKILHESARLYESALRNTNNEIVDAAEIKNRLLRTTGVISTLFTDLANKSKGKSKHEYLRKSVEYAEKELSSRIKNGETSGLPLLNSYHTLGCQQSELAEQNEKMYKSAWKNLSIAMELTKSPDGKIKYKMVHSILQFRLSWLEFKANPANKDVIRGYIDIVLNHQKKYGYEWNPAVKGKLKDMMEILGQHLGGDYPSKIKGMYGAVDTEKLA